MRCSDSLIESPDRYLSRPEAADYLRVSLRTLDGLAASGDPPAIRLGTRVVFDRADLDVFMTGRKAAATQPATGQDIARGEG